MAIVSFDTEVRLISFHLYSPPGKTGLAVSRFISQPGQSRPNDEFPDFLMAHASSDLHQVSGHSF